MTHKDKANAIKGSGNRISVKQVIKDYALITAGVMLVVIGVYFFKFPNNFAIGGVTGVAMILSSLFKGAVSSATIVLVIDILLLIIGYAVIGRKFGVRTLYGSLLFALALNVLEKVMPMTSPITDQPMLELAFAVLFPALGSAILFNMGASTGGTDISAMLLKKYTSMDIGRSLLVSDFLLTAAGFFVFDVTTVLFSMLGLLLKSTLVDGIIESLNLNKYFTIISSCPKEICDFIIEKLKRSATVFDGKGAFTNEDRKIIITVMNRSQAVQLRAFIKNTDPHAFMLITNTSEIIGKGFRGVS
jgi:uncharacterized membrane-anchored protein YitT (DUF2179 family)